jgi:phosphatidylserine/phosphatidylglycerophosphate/cardiolipin synthase-like enzyme
LNHSKIIIIDEEVIISTWNLTHSTFVYNRDFFVFINDEKIVWKLNEIFISDYKWENNYTYDDNLIISPHYSRKKIEYLLNNVKEKIDIYIPYIQDDEMEELLMNKIKNWIKISIIISEDWYKDNEIKMNKLEKKWIKIKIMKNFTMHSKAILVDNKFLFIWSTNFSIYSIDKNREIWILLKDKIIIEKFINIFNKDFY